MLAPVRAGLVAIATLALIAMTAATSSADAKGGQNPKAGGEVAGGTPSVVIAMDGSGREFARRTYRSRSSGPTWVCHYYAVRAADGTYAELTLDRSTEITPEVGRPVGLVCFEDGRTAYTEIFVFDPQQPFGSQFAAGDAALLARELLPIPDPDIVTSPPADRAQLAGLSTWLSVGSAWQTFSATATLGGVSATVTATPVAVAWDPGDGSPTITCDGPGSVFDPARPDATTDCAHTYTVATAPGTTIALTATITYDVAWTATDGSGDVLDPVTRTATVPLTIGEVQALIR